MTITMRNKGNHLYDVRKASIASKVSKTPIILGVYIFQYDNSKFTLCIKYMYQLSGGMNESGYKICIDFNMKSIPTNRVRAIP